MSPVSIMVIIIAIAIIIQIAVVYHILKRLLLQKPQGRYIPKLEYSKQESKWMWIALDTKTDSIHTSNGYSRNHYHKRDCQVFCDSLNSSELE